MVSFLAFALAGCDEFISALEAETHRNQTCLSFAAGAKAAKQATQTLV